MIAFVRGLHLDPKLVRTILTAAVTWAVLKLGLSVDDPNVAAGVSLLVGAAVGYVTKNAGSALRKK